MKLVNNSELNLSHELDGQIYTLKIGQKLDIPKQIADIWLKMDGVEIYVTAEDVEKQKQEAVNKAVAEALEKAKEPKKVEPIKAPAKKKATKKTTKKTK